MKTNENKEVILSLQEYKARRKFNFNFARQPLQVTHQIDTNGAPNRHQSSHALKIDSFSHFSNQFGSKYTTWFSHMSSNQYFLHKFIPFFICLSHCQPCSLSKCSNEYQNIVQRIPGFVKRIMRSDKKTTYIGTWTTSGHHITGTSKTSLKESILVMIMMYYKTKEVLKTQWNIGRHGFVRGQDW